MEKDKSQTGVVAGKDFVTLVFGISLADPALSCLGAPQLAEGKPDHLTAAVLKSQVPPRIVCPLIGGRAMPSFDALSIIDTLVEVGFGGELVVLAPPLLRPKMVESELRSLARRMRLRLVVGAMPPLDHI